MSELLNCPCCGHGAELIGRTVELQYNGIDEYIYNPDAHCNDVYDNNNVLDEAISKNKKIIITPYRRDSINNIKVQMAASQIIFQNQLADILHIIVGPGSEEFSYNGCHYGIGVASFDELAYLYTLADVFMQIQLVSDLGRCACEAMMCGTPVIVSGGTGNARLHINKTNGYLIPECNWQKPEHIFPIIMLALKEKLDKKSIVEYACDLWSLEHNEISEANRYRRILHEHSK